MRVAQALLWAVLVGANLVAVLSIVAGRNAERPRRYAARTAIAVVVVIAMGFFTMLYGLKFAFDDVADVDPSAKAAHLARGISEAMNCAAFAALAAILPAAATIWLLLRKPGAA